MPKIIDLHIENVKRIKAVHIDFTDNLTVIGGNNGNGKSSALDSLIMLFGGEAVIPPVPVRNGAESAQIVAKLDNGMVVTRLIMPDGKSKLTVTSADGKAKYSSPQGLLNGMTGSISFDALAFTRLDSRKQLETLRRLTGLDFTDLDAARKRLYEERTLVNRDGTTKAAQVEKMEFYADALAAAVDVEAIRAEIAALPAVPLELAEIDSEIERAEESNVAIYKLSEYANIATEERGLLEKRYNDTSDLIADLTKQLTEAKSKLAKLSSDLSYAREEEALRKSEAQKAEKGRIDISAIKHRRQEMFERFSSERMERVKEIQEREQAARDANYKLEVNTRRKAADKELKALREQSRGLTKRIEELDADKQAQLAAAKFPVAGLSFGESGITLNGLPFEQASSAERLRVSVAIGAALAPQLKAMCIYDGSLLDEDHMKFLRELAVEHDLQILMERVGKGDECSLIIEDGEVEEQQKTS